jgi:hypothetical protein
MAHMKTGSTGIREHIEYITFGFARIVTNTIDPVLFP